MTSEHSTDLREYVRILRERKLEVLIPALLVLAAALFFTFQQTPIYEGRAKVLVQPIQSPLVISSSDPRRGFTVNLDTERELVRSQAIAEAVAEEMAPGLDADALLKNLTVEIIVDTDILVIKYHDPNPREAARLANAFATTYIDYRREQALIQLEAAAQTVQQRIDAIQVELRQINDELEEAQGSRRADLQTQKDAIVARLGVLTQQFISLQPDPSNQQVGQIVEEPDIPESPVSPNKVRNGILGLLAGLALGIGLAFLRERLDDRIKTREEVERRLDAPVIAAVPRVSGWRRTQEAQLIMRSDPKSPISEAYRTLGTNILYMASREPLKVVMVTSALGSEGKTTTASNLSIALARAGKHVILVSADLRRPRVHQFFGVANDIGLSNVLSDSTPLTAAAKDPDIPNLRVITGGPVPADPAALLGSPRAAEFLESLRDVCDFVIVDCPPVLAVADASILAPLVDGTLYVMDAEHSSRSALRHARDQLENAGARIMGAVYNNFDPTKGTGYSSYYYYYYQYYGAEEELVQNGAKSRGQSRRLRRRARKQGTPQSVEAGRS